uniref:glucan 1,3-beta-glucosidase n=1 Tax=Achlya hypogyna TaxID=1202772 RepID=A0A0A7CNM0_ACHHY|nr:secreted protein [Achlya hypogyna]
MHCTFFLSIVTAALAGVAGHVQQRIRSGAVKARGVNLGSWLVTEHFMMPQSPIYQNVSADLQPLGEYVVTTALGRAVADPLFKAHRSSWITENDIKEIASFGLNTVRVPVGWWIYEDPNDSDWQAYSPGGIQYLDALINDWALKYNVAVLVGMHGAKGSQNGEGHSAPQLPGESHFTDDADNVYTTMQSAKFIMSRYQSSVAFLGLEMLNEPTITPGRVYNIDRTKLIIYYTNLYSKLRAICSSCIIMLSPLLNEQYESFGNQWANVLPTGSNNWIDWHKYLIWGFENWSMKDIINTGTQWIANDITLWQSRRSAPIFVGEWSLAAAEGILGELKNGTNLNTYANRALAAMKEAKAGWTYWSWKVNATDWRSYGWNMQALLRAGVIDLKNA